MYNEVAVVGIPHILEHHIESGLIEKQSCDNYFEELKKYKAHSGEKECMCIALSNDAREYILFTNDIRAGNLSYRLGIIPLDIIGFLQICAKTNILDKARIFHIVSKLKQRNYPVDDDFISNLK